uniref:Pentatricopeptide repeat-containing protein At2g22410, mitochondrial-like n=2 Tax=Elaeis guineensis var. tenera TaxID=51953 RepID=A0A8N4F1A2_ELAGV|nr:pentatricopeptide repeat-containing protein At2g22410, mitochondrial-like [Elaeis guineensis]
MPPPLLPRLPTSPLKAHFLHRILLQFFSYSAKPKWNSNHNLIITHPVLSIMESCNSMAELKQIQAHMTRTGLIAHRFPASRVLAFCALSDSGDISHARIVFAQIPGPNTYIWNTMIRGYTRSKHPRSSLSLFCQMICQRVVMDSRTFVFVLKACEQFLEVFMGEEIHCMICKLGFDSDLLVENGLMHFYVKNGLLDSARKVFVESCQRDVVSWTTMIDGYSQKGLPDEALRLFYRMLLMNIQPNEVTMITVLSAISQLGHLRLGKLVHEFIWKSEMNVTVNLMNALVDVYGKCGCVDSAREVFDSMGIKDVFSWTSMVNAYAKCGDLQLARQFFESMPERNAVSWSSMIAAYAQANQAKEALELFHEMLGMCVKPIDATLVSVLSACAQSGCLDLGRWIYDHFIDRKIIKLSMNLANAFIGMYAKCGDIKAAARLFHEMPERDIVSWNAMIMAYAVHGYGNEALTLFEQLKSEGMVPDDITFVGVLSACSHAGLVVEGLRHFKDMRSIFGIEPKSVHYACQIDLLGKVGLLEDAYELVRSMPVEPDEAAWGALLNACRIHGKVELGKYAGDKLLGLDPGDSGIYVLLSSMYATRNKWDDVKKVRRMMRDRGVKKTPGCSSIEVDGKFHEFFVADTSHVLSKDIYMTLDNIYLQLRIEGYVPKS